MSKNTLQLHPNFNHIPVQSTKFLSAAWDQNVLQIRFNNGALYNYYNVPEEIYRDLIDPELQISKGIYLRRMIEDPAQNPNNTIRWYKRVK